MTGFPKEQFLAQLERMGRPLDRRVSIHEQIDSTSDELLRCLRDGAPVGTVVIASAQTGGRGRNRKPWHSPSNGNLYISMSVSVTGEAVENLPLIPLAAGIAAIDAIEDAGGTRPLLKWPNDLMVNDRKLGGILCEAPDIAARPVIALVGLGLNTGGGDFPAELDGIAIDMAAVADRVPPLPLIAARWVAGVERWNERIEKGDRADLVMAWRERAEAFGRMVRVGDVQGRTVDLNELGQLLIEKNDGAVVAVPGGIVEHME